MESEENERLPFLDVLVIRCDDVFLTTIYRKPSFTGVYFEVCVVGKVFVTKYDVDVQFFVRFGTLYLCENYTKMITLFDSLLLLCLYGESETAVCRRNAYNTIRIILSNYTSTPLLIYSVGF